MSIAMRFGTRLARYAMAALATIFMAAQPASAGSIDWSFSFSLDSGVTGSGVFVTQDAPSGGPFLITSIQNGLLNGDTMTLLPPETSQFTGNPFNDDLLSANQPSLDFEGLGFTAGGVIWALWSDGGAVVDSWCNN